MHTVKLKWSLVCIAAIAPAGLGCEVIWGLGDPDLLGASTTAGTGGTGSQTTTSGPACSAGDAVSCYSGPNGTEGVGICTAGQKICLDDGSGFGPCNDEVLPKAEDCATVEDENCDGNLGDCAGLHLWSKRFGDATAQRGEDVAIDSDGNVIIVGSFHGVINFGGGPLESTVGSGDVFVTKLDSDGKHLWSKRFGDGADQQARRVAVDHIGKVYVGGIFEGGIDFGEGVIWSDSMNDVFVAKLDPDGNHIWSRRFGGPDDQFIGGLEVDSQNNVLLAGSFLGTMDFQTPALVANGSYDLYLAKLDPAGAVLWSKRYGNDQVQVGRGLGVGPLDEVIVGGDFSGDIDLGAGTLHQSKGQQDLFFAQFSKSGGASWSKSVGAAGADEMSDVAVDANGNVLLAGRFQGSIDFGGDPLPTASGVDLFVAKLDTTGQALWSRSANASNGGKPAAFVSADGAGNVVLTGNFDASVKWGPGPNVPVLESAGENDVFVTKLSPEGAFLWARRFGDVKDQTVAASAVDSMGAIVVTGSFAGTVDFGGNALVSAGGSDIYLVKLSP